MKTLYTILYAGVLVAGAATCMAGPVSTIDTSILKNGNTWTYTHNDHSGPYYDRWLTGITVETKTGLSLDSLVTEGDTVSFRLIQRDTTVTRWAHMQYQKPDSIVTDPPIYANSETVFKFSRGSYLPSTPQFARYQSFEMNDIRVNYGGDTLKYKEYTTPTPSGYPGGLCNYTTRKNLQGIGNIYEKVAETCANQDRVWSITLTSFNGLTVASDSLTPVSIRPLISNTKPSPGVQIKTRVLFEKNGTLYDSRGNKIPESTLRP